MLSKCILCHPKKSCNRAQGPLVYPAYWPLSKPPQLFSKSLDPEHHLRGEVLTSIHLSNLAYLKSSEPKQRPSRSYSFKLFHPFLFPFPFHFCTWERNIFRIKLHWLFLRLDFSLRHCLCRLCFSFNLAVPAWETQFINIFCC